MQIRILGDVHEKQEEYIEIIKDAQYSIQLGDMGFNYDKIQSVDSRRHRVLYGNHDKLTTDDYGRIVHNDPRFFPNYGSWIHSIIDEVKTNIPDIFVVRGEHSIDKEDRIEGFNWFPNEQMTYREMCNAIELYKNAKPKIVVSHGCPSSIIQYVGNPAFAYMDLKPSATAKLLQAMYDFHQPDVWLFAHYHINRCVRPDYTYFFCIDKLNYLDIEDVDNGYRVKADYFNMEIKNVD